MVQDDPFAVLGLPALAELTDDDVRAAWRRIAAATHPDREDGGDPARFGAAAAAYALLRTSFGRGEALADLSSGAHPRHSRRARGARRTPRSWSAWRSWRERRPWREGRSWHLARPADVWHPQRRGAHRLHAAAPPARSPRHSGNARPRAAGYAGFRRTGYAGFRRAGYVSIDRGLALPAGGATLGAAAAIAAAGWTPATIGLVAGALTVTGWGLWRRAWRDR